VDRDDAMKIVGYLEASYQRPPSPPERIEAYVNRLLDLDFDAAMLGAIRLAETSTFYPSIAELREAATVAYASDLPDPDAAWAMVALVIQGESRAGLPPIVVEIIESMGVYTLRSSTNPATDRAHFLRMYDTARRRHAQQRQVSPKVRELSERLANRYALPAGTSNRHPAPPEEQLAALDRYELEEWMNPRRELAARIAQVPETMGRDEQLAVLDAMIEAEDLEAQAQGRCCHLHGRACEPPSELCCEGCSERAHPDHPAGVPCVLTRIEGV
jgi:hypothetical protein